MRKALFMMVVLLFAVALTGCQGVSLIEGSRTISVQGTGTVPVTPDIASFSVTVSELAETTREAQVQTNGKVGAILEMVRAAGVADKDIRTTALEFFPEYRWKENEQVLVGQRVRQRVHITIRGVGEGSSVLSSLIDEIGTVTGISIESIAFSKEDTSAEYAESRKLAMQKAIQKATEYAQAANMVLGKPLSVSDYSSGDSQVSSRNTVMKASVAYMAESVPSAEIPVGELDVVSVVSVLFELL